MAGSGDYVTDNHPKRSPISMSSSSSLGGGGGAYFFFSSFLGASLAALGASVAAEAEGADPPKLKNELISLPSRAFANILGQ